MELLSRPILPGVLALLAAFAGGCMVPGPLRNPRALEAGDRSVRAGVAGHYAYSRRARAHTTDHIHTVAAELSYLRSRGLGRGWEWDIGVRGLAPVDIGLLGGFKWQWLGAGEPRALASSLVLDGSTLALVSPNDLGASSLWALPLGNWDLVLGGRYGWRFGSEGGASYERATGFLARPQGGFWEAQMAVQAAVGAEPRPYAGVTVRQDVLPNHADFSFSPMIRIEAGLEFKP